MLVENCTNDCRTGPSPVRDTGSSSLVLGGRHTFSTLTEKQPNALLLGLLSVLLAAALVSCSPGPPTGGGQASYVTDFSDDRKLVGFADDVFFGQVVENLGTSERQGLPESQFRVQVLETLKGTLEGEVTVNQSAEFHVGGSQDESMGEPALLERGNSYLLVTRRSQETGWHTVASPYGRILIRRVSKEMSREKILIRRVSKEMSREKINSPHANELRSRFTQAVVNEIPLP